MDQIYQVASSSGVNVRQNPGTGACIITTQANTANVVAVPDVDAVYKAPYWWIEVAYFQHYCQTCNNYDWDHVGWIAVPFLRAATAGIRAC